MTICDLVKSGEGKISISKEDTEFVETRLFGELAVLRFVVPVVVVKRNPPPQRTVPLRQTVHARKGNDQKPNRRQSNGSAKPTTTSGRALSEGVKRFRTWRQRNSLGQATLTQDEFLIRRVYSGRSLLSTLLPAGSRCWNPLQFESIEAGRR